MTRSTLTSKHQTTIPKVVVEALKLRPSDHLVYEIEADGRVILTAKTASFREVAEQLDRKGLPRRCHSVDEVKDSVGRMATKRLSRGKA
jgi:bifunctional DNA-binding transcriptional regulator/antitoxin component of YhaV-PrlF toxin-antitoxin module